MRSRLSILSTLLGLGAAISIAATPAGDRWHSQEHAASRGEVPSIHASLGFAVPATGRATDTAPAHRRAPTPSGTALVGRIASAHTRSTAIARVRPSPDRPAATRLAARGYDATAPPLG